MDQSKQKGQQTLRNYQYQYHKAVSLDSIFTASLKNLGYANVVTVRC